MPTLKETLKTAFDAARDAGAPYMVYMQDRQSRMETVQGSNLTQPATGVPDILGALKKKNEAGGMYENFVLTAVFDTRRAFDPQYDLQHLHGPYPGIVSPVLATECKKLFDERHSEIYRLKRKKEDEERRRRRRRRRLHGF